MSEALYKIIPSCSDPSLIKQITNNEFSYTNSIGSINHYLIFKSYNAYKKGSQNIPHKLHKSNSFYIAELE